VQTAPDTVFLAEDEAGLYLQATTVPVWAPVGQTPVVRVDPGRAQTHFYGSLNLLTGPRGGLALRRDECPRLRSILGNAADSTSRQAGGAVLGSRALAQAQFALHLRDGAPA